MIVTLESYELSMAALVGLRRQLLALQRNCGDRHGFTGDGWGVHIEGACGELAFAKATGRYWNGSNGTFRQGGDVGAIQVRTRSQEQYQLMVRPDDEDRDMFVLVRGRAPQFMVVGWTYGADAKEASYLQTYGGRPPAYFVPDRDLKPIEFLCVEDPSMSGVCV